MHSMASTKEESHDLTATLNQIASTAARVESLADQISSMKLRILELDKKRQGAVEALAQFRASHREKMANRRIGKQVWVSSGPVFLQFESKDAELMCQQQRDVCTEQIDETRRNMKRLCSELLKLSPDQHMDPTTLKLLLSEAKTESKAS